MADAAQIMFAGDSVAILTDDLRWKHEDKDLRSALNLLTELILDDYSVAFGDRIIWLFEQMVETLQPKESKLTYKIPPKPRGRIVDG